MSRGPIRFWILLAVLLTASPMFGQRTAASVRGTVVGPDGNPIAGVQVTIVNSETGFERTRSSNQVGAYSFADLPVGHYVLTAEAEGFKSVMVQNITLSVAQIREQEIEMEIGAVSDEMTVTSQALTIKTVGGEVSGLITGEQIRELPLNGRNFMQLTQLMPGVAAPDAFNTKNKGLLTGADVSVSGTSTTANMWAVDGANNNDVGSNRTILVYPSLEAVEEMKVHRNSYGAEFGGAGAQVNLVTRSGTNDFKGSVFYFKRDDSWNETNYFLRETGGETEPLDRDDYGYTFGGPILRDRVHFFVSQEWNEEVRGVVRSAQVPTALEKQGDFSQTNPACQSIPVDPSTGQPFPGNVIPGDRVSAAGSNYVNLYPDANATIPGSCNNWVAALSTPLDWDQINARLDWNVTDSVRALVRYTEDDWNNVSPTAGDANGLWGDDAFPAVDSDWEQPSESLVAQVSSVLGASALNTLTYSYSGNEINISEGGQDPALADAIRATIPNYFPQDGKLLGPDEYQHPIFWGGGGYDALWSQGPWRNDQDLEVFKDDYEQVFGNHVVKAGVLYSENKKLEVVNNASAESSAIWGPAATGTIGNAWGGGTGNTIADFLLEDTTWGFSEISTNVVSDIRWEDYEAYIGDSWKLSSNVTLDLGLRYSLFKEPYDANPNQFLSFNPDRYDPALGSDPCNGLMQVPGTDPCGQAGFLGGTDGPNKSLINEDDDNFAPRLGLAWDMFDSGRSILRVGGGLFYQRDRVSPHLSLDTNPPQVETASGLRTLDGQFTGIGTAAGIPRAGFDIDRETPYSVQYNVTWEQQVFRNSTFEISYVANKARHQLRSQNINYVPVEDVNGNGQSDRLDYIQCGAGDAACRGALRRFSAFGDNNILYWTTDGASDYDSIQTQWITTFGRGSQIQASYTYADFDTDFDVNGSSGGFNAEETVTDPQNLALDEGRAELDRTHSFNLSAIYNLPTLEGVGGFKEWVLGNWSIGGIVVYSSGQPLTVFTGSLPGIGTAGSGAGYSDSARPMRVAGVPCGGSGAQLLNPNAFTLTGYQLGTSGQMASRGVCEGPSFFQVDLSLYKQIPIGNRFNVQLRIEAFNIFNRDNFMVNGWNGGWVNTVTYDSDTAPTTIVDSTAQGNFGQATRARDPRQFQLGLKITF